MDIDLEHGGRIGVARVDSLTWDHQRHAVGLHLSNDLGQMHKASSQAIKLKRDHGINLASTNERLEFVQPLTARLGSLCRVSEPPHVLPAPALAVVL
jgi:hypothetical protein